MATSSGGSIGIRPAPRMGRSSSGSTGSTGQAAAELQIVSSQHHRSAAAAGFPSSGRGACRGCLRTLASVVFSGVGVLMLLLVYVVGCAVIFKNLEGGQQQALQHHQLQHQSESESTSFQPGVLSLGVQEQHHLRAAKALRQQTVDRLWKITEELNILYKANWTALATREIVQFQKELIAAELLQLREKKLKQIREEAEQDEANDYQRSRSSSSSDDTSLSWSFSSSFLYALSLITTVGSGQQIPTSFLGKIVSMLCALFGIPLLLLYLHVVGSCLARNFLRIFRSVCHCCPKGPTSAAALNKKGSSTSSSRSNSGGFLATDASSTGGGSDMELSFHQDLGSRASLRYPCPECRGRGHLPRRPSPSAAQSSMAPLWLCVLFLLTYVCFGASFFWLCMESWSWMDSLFFCFTTLATIGMLKHHSQAHDQKLQSGGGLFVVACTLYLLIGLALLAMCLELWLERQGPWPRHSSPS